ncbi:adenylate/guanylate cyclase domain-containing protein [Acinetobacter schindleri]|uniref:Adenylate/guanylate cyclase domain-containing protein n=1 Tax=Acinetobacter schindleri TaxID=108981 RepID=A0AAE6WWJ8_9GAMM|nr:MULTISPECIES: adenylate/guanylate cyclase domain-containing protein [Acinetobacter]MCK8639947.1 adenylate/guanylate cyclase domain-containing protein [Acinetobacter schindleri]QIC68285.1 adenylate/guanylate cyclase domain-containing protein [Acinetobacter schindleri]
MQANYKTYDFQKSRDRIDEILNSSDNNYEEKESIPNRDTLTFNNGYYICCSAIFIDMRGSKEFSKKHTRPVTAKIYRSYISELVAVLNSNIRLREIYIEGDCVWGVFNTPNKSDVDSILDTAAQAASLIDTLNVKLRKKKYSEITVGIACHDADVLMIKAGYSGSGINEVTWIGKLVGETADLCSKASRWNSKRTLYSKKFYDSLTDKERKRIDWINWNYTYECYEGNTIYTSMNNWVLENG